MTASEPVYESRVARLRAAGCVFAEEEAELLLVAASRPEPLEELLGRRVAGEPLELLLGWVDFAGVRVAVAPGVFVPRQRTAYVVELAAARLAAGSVVVDLCCGSGALGLALSSAVPGRSEEHTSELQSLMRISYAGFCLKKKKTTTPLNTT